MKKTSFLSIVALTTLSLFSLALTMEKEHPADNTQKEQPKNTQTECDIFVAIEKGDLGQAKEFVEKYRNDATKMNEARWHIKTPLLYAIKANQEEIAKLLIFEKATDINKTGYKDRTPLHQACALKMTSIVEILLAKGAKTDLKDTDGDTPMHDALSEENDLGDEKIHKIISTRSLDIINLLLENNEARKTINELNQFDGETPFTYAITRNNLDAVILFLKNGAEINTPLRKEIRPLFIAIHWAKSMFGAGNNKIEIIKQLLLNGAADNLDISSLVDDVCDCNGKLDDYPIIKEILEYLCTTEKYRTSKNKNQFINEKQKELEEKLKNPEKLSTQKKDSLLTLFFVTDVKTWPKNNNSKLSLVKEFKKFVYEYLKDHANPAPAIGGFIEIKSSLSDDLTDAEKIKTFEKFVQENETSEAGEPFFTFIKKRSDLYDEEKRKQEIEKNEADFMELYKEAECRRFDFLVQLHKKDEFRRNMFNDTHYTRRIALRHNN